MMSYNYSEIREYIKKICQKFDVKIPLSADLTSWEMAKEAIERAAKAFQSAVMVSSPPQERQRLFAALMIEIGRATFFAQQNPNYVTRLDIYIAGALDYVQQFQGLAELTQPEYQRTDKQISIEQTKDKTEVDDFRGYSSAFKKLCDYQKFLSADTRHHLFRVQDKAEKLGILLECLKNASSKTEMKHVLQDFYAGKGRAESLYETLNKGQGPVSRILGFFNSNTHTTTLELIDNLAEHFDMGNLVPESPAFE